MTCTSTFSPASRLPPDDGQPPRAGHPFGADSAKLNNQKDLLGLSFFRFQLYYHYPSRNIVLRINCSPKYVGRLTVVAFQPPRTTLPTRPEQRAGCLGDGNTEAAIMHQLHAVPLQNKSERASARLRPSGTNVGLPGVNIHLGARTKYLGHQSEDGYIYTIQAGEFARDPSDAGWAGLARKP